MPKSILCTFLIVLSFSGCKSDKASGPEETSSSTSIAPAAAPEEEAGTVSEIRYTWVDQVNVRDQPSTAGKVVARVRPNEPLTLTGETSPASETIVLRGVAYHEPWYRITTADKKDGWVFGGTIREKDERKGTALLEPLLLDFPAFGTYNLEDWKAEPRAREEGGDAEIETLTYVSPAGQVMRIESSDTGEYGYTYNYKLEDAQGNLLKERTFAFTADPREVTEEVIDYTDTPAKRYSRTQKMEKHFMQLNERPRMARGEWTVERLD